MFELASLPSHPTVSIMRKITLMLGLIAAATISEGAAAQNLVQNGSFETRDFTSWTGTGNTTFNGVYCPGSSGAGVVAGDCAGFFGPVGSVGGISQTLATIIGKSYTFSFWVVSDGASNNTFAALIGGNSVYSETNVGTTKSQHAVNFLATSNSTSIGFNIRNDPGFTFVDDVQFTVTPEPSTYLLMASGLVLIGVMARRRRAS